MIRVRLAELNGALTKFRNGVPTQELDEEIGVCLDILRENGPLTGRPTSKSLKDGIFELRPSTKDHVARLLYCFHQGHAVFLVCFIKQGGKDPTNAYKQDALKLKARLERGKETLHGYN